jgi:hypothetical protein
MTYGYQIVDLVKFHHNFSTFYTTVLEFLDKAESRFRFSQENENRYHKIEKNDELSPARTGPNFIFLKFYSKRKRTFSSFIFIFKKFILLYFDAMLCNVLSETENQ